jgi:flagellar hook-associated protein 1
MTGTFGSFNTALTAIRYQRVAMDVASNNIANVSTEGYVRRRAEAASIGGPVSGVWSRYDGVGQGVASLGTTRLTDVLLDARSRAEHGKQSYLDTRATVLARVESGLGEPGDNGVNAALSDFRASWQDLENQPDSEAARTQVLQAGQSLADTIKAQAANIDNEQGTQRAHLLDVVNQANTTAQSLAAVNQSILTAKASNVDTADLLDQRDALATKLSELTGGTATERADGGMDVSVGGQSLVSGKTAGAIAVTGGINPDGSSDGAALTLSVGGQPVAAGAFGGEAGATGELLTTTLPGMMSKLDSIASQLADSVNALHTTGYDQDGTAGTAFFSYDAANAASSLGVAITDPRKVAASDVAGGGLGTGIAEKLGETGTVESSYQRLVSDLGSQVDSAKKLASTQQLLTTQVDSSREQISGVNLDEETVNLVAAQRAYEAAARVMTTMDDILDTLINRMAR